MIGRGGERGSGISVLAARHDDDDDNDDLKLYNCLLIDSCPPPQLDKCPGYDIKQSEREVPVMLELWGM